MQEVDKILSHYGTLGMRWGIRKSSKSSGGAPTPITINAKPGKKIVTSGGKNLPVSEDAKAAAIYKQKARSSGPQSLSNQEMRLIVDRMNLEQQYNKLNPKQKSLGEKFLKEYGPSAGLMGFEMVKSNYKNVENLDPKIAKRLQYGDLIAQQIKSATASKKKK